MLFFCHYYYSANSTLLSLLSFSYFITSYAAQASCAFSALILCMWGGGGEGEYIVDRIDVFTLSVKNCSGCFY